MKACFNENWLSKSCVLGHCNIDNKNNVKIVRLSLFLPVKKLCVLWGSANILSLIHIQMCIRDRLKKDNKQYTEELSRKLEETNKKN